MSVSHFPFRLQLPQFRKMSRPFAVVEFQEENKVFVSVVSASWLSESDTKCAWPTGIGSHQKLISHSKPKESWTIYPCCVLKRCGKLQIRISTLSFKKLAYHNLKLVFKYFYCLFSQFGESQKSGKRGTE